ncbi:MULTISPECIES: thiamine-phosphate kinase [unclassified Sphingomonas]|uniref:thiamine-phosphate kinase n=1 Tax=unclassified Sphingomonas TaxID=196159 RepID=UPI0006F5FF79|nr:MULTISPECIES: thiamine-phosphate kinase [unclassified Sphingomonas]KQN14050.1 thiamine-monophosphate kinase [Sphingomonas sp. Leaf30]MBD8550908.1 thiamine-phosphate kinase [Sphingomonas sp. CFBP 8764]
MTEAEFIAALRRLPLHPAARGLNDDTALLDAGPLVVTTDTLVEGVHFLPTDPAQDVAWKLVATNLSDLAAKGAVPEGILLNYPLGDDAWDRAFLEGLADILTAHDTRLIGGDTVTLPPGAPRILTVTAFGSDAAAPARAGAKPGDALYVTGTIGDAGAGLAIALGKHGPAELLAAYHRPQPRLADGRRLARHVHAMMDVSDGLLIDAARMALASGLAVTIDLAAIPLSDAYRMVSGDRVAAATAGDDYQLLFAAPEDFATDATRIGAFFTGSGLVLHDAGTPVPLPPSLGYEHRA